jgi:hypothetical protein
VQPWSPNSITFANSFARLTSAQTRGSLPFVKGKKEQVQKPTAGTVVGAKYRARCNQLGDNEREKLGDAFLKLYYGRPVRAARRR